MKHFDFSAFSACILQLKKENGISLSQFSDAGVTKSTLSRATQGRTLDINNIIAICDFMDLSITDFIKSKTPNNGKSKKGN